MYRAVMFAGIPSIFTGFKQGAFSLSINQKLWWDPTSLNKELQANTGAISLGIKQPPRLFREVLEKCSNYSCALQVLQSTQIVTPCYFTLVGTMENEGAVISRNRTHTINTTYVSDENWYLVQTNDDHYLGECKSRCQSARKNLDVITRQKIDPDTTYTNVLNVAPVLNTLSVYASSMIPSAGLFITRIVNGTVVADDLY